MPRNISVIIGLLLGLMSFAVSAYAASEADLVASGEEAEVNDDPSDNEIQFYRNVTVKVGESVVIHGMRSDCGQVPDRVNWTDGQTQLGTLTLGKPGVRRSRSCGGMTPAIEVVFTAKTVGGEDVTIFGDTISIIVIE